MWIGGLLHAMRFNHAFKIKALRKIALCANLIKIHKDKKLNPRVFALADTGAIRVL